MREPDVAKNAVLVKSEPLPEEITSQVVRGYDFNEALLEGGRVDFGALLNTYARSGFQATNLGRAIEEINRMLSWRLSDEAMTENEPEEFKDPEVRKKQKCKIFLGYTSNLISSGLREVIRFLVQHKMVDVIVTSAGGVEEDLIKCLAPTYVGDFELGGKALRERGLNRIGNLLVPNNNYGLFEDFILPVLDSMLKEQQETGTLWCPSTMIARLGKEINNEDSVYYWAWKNQIPVYSPAITDGSIGDMVYFHSYRNPGLVIDIAKDIRNINSEAVFAPKTGMIILGGGVVKHHICNANLMRNGADFAVYINTGAEFDGSDAGARPDEAISWGKIRMDARPVKVYAEATLVFPLIVAQTFVKELAKRKQETKEKDSNMDGPAQK